MFFSCIYCCRVGGSLGAELISRSGGLYRVYVIVRNTDTLKMRPPGSELSCSATNEYICIWGLKSHDALHWAAQTNARYKLYVIVSGSVRMQTNGLAESKRVKWQSRKYYSEWRAEWNKTSFHKFYEFWRNVHPKLYDDMIMTSALPIRLDTRRWQY